MVQPITLKESKQPEAPLFRGAEVAVPLLLVPGFELDPELLFWSDESPLASSISSWNSLWSGTLVTKIVLETSKIVTCASVLWKAAATEMSPVRATSSRQRASPLHS